ncbi:uncharacterized protein Z518_05969 [Rhinocladiella mackenziei CBS 650.93]|uniref:Uncharacterized protein n=1 Tax=Rhinocladiella mackenziei CBS 650.93 TaxID=1442369 RepID=A0A0D2FSJ4_9EURO|nr:uncharacterized protein Z518_05969 [Rhinocladiella mackenziei CBS 650.93]KIX05097.1 hypothetical protein Z518_05969 [Rhinocladiella mackenziei CBS 650.93]
MASPEEVPDSALGLASASDADTIMGDPAQGSDEDTAQTSNDLSGLGADKVTKLSEVLSRNNEVQGLAYDTIYQQLQIRPEKRQEFYNGVIRNIRNKHHVEIKRGTDTSIKNISNLLLRAFGYLVWAPDSAWLVDIADLDEGETRLVYVRGRVASDRPENERFFPILERLWRQMRNLMFIAKPSRRRAAQAQSGTLPRAEEDETTEMNSGLSEGDIPPPSPHSQARTSATEKIEALQDKWEMAMAPISEMTADETEEAILNLITKLSQIRAKSRPEIFERLWVQHIMRQEEIDSASSQGTIEPAPVTGNMTPQILVKGSSVPPIVANPPPQPGGGGASSQSPVADSSSQSNQPWMTEGSPLPPRLPMSSLLRPALPAVMSVYISVLYIPSAAIRAGTQPCGPIIPARGGHRDPAYHWVDAPVSTTGMARFFEGITMRTRPLLRSVVGWVFSYGWNDTCRFISSGRFDYYDRTAGTEVGIPRDNAQSTIVNTMMLGWGDFQDDLRHAAQTGVRVWRMKVGVVALPE